MLTTHIAPPKVQIARFGQKEGIVKLANADSALLLRVAFPLYGREYTNVRSLVKAANTPLRGFGLDKPSAIS